MENDDAKGIDERKLHNPELGVQERQKGAVKEMYSESAGKGMMAIVGEEPMTSRNGKAYKYLQFHECLVRKAHISKVGADFDAWGSVVGSGGAECRVGPDGRVWAWLEEPPEFLLGPSFAYLRSDTTRL